MRRKRPITESRLWAPPALDEPRLLAPGQLDYPSGLIGQPPQPPPARAPAKATAPRSGSCLQWERAMLGSLSEQPLVSVEVPFATPDRQAAGERYLAHLWATHGPHFSSTRPAPELMLTDELRADTVAQYLPEPHLIKVRPQALTRHVLAHECCHAWTTAQHDTAFAAGMLYLMQQEFGCDRGELLAHAQAMGLQIAR